MERTPLPEMNTPFTQFITDSVLTMSRELNGVLGNRVFRRFIGAVLQVGDSAVLVNQRVNTAFFNAFLITIKRISRRADDFTGF